MRAIRLASGVLLFAFVTIHLISVSFGLIGLEAMERSREILMAPFANPIGGSILILAFFVHMGAGLWTLFTRRTLALNWGDGIQAVSGLLIAPLLLPHAVAAIGVPMLGGERLSYGFALTVFSLWAPESGLRQTLLLIVAWAHACYGLELVLRIQDWWTRAALWAYPFAALLPVTALLGYIAGVYEVYAGFTGDPEFAEYATYTGQPGFVEAVEAEAAIASAMHQETLNAVRANLFWGYCGLIALALLLRAIFMRRRRGAVTLLYGGEETPSKAGLSLLDSARRAELPHAELCGGRGRCGSCAVRVREGAVALSPMLPIERATLQKFHYEDDVRLACQAHLLEGAASVEPLVDPSLAPADYLVMMRERVAAIDAQKTPEESAAEAETGDAAPLAEAKS